MKLKDKVTVITNPAYGIDRTFAEAYIKEGAKMEIYSFLKSTL
ncbi:hypothetical protein ACFLTP_06480 [Chloroflexota bacterium]